MLQPSRLSGFIPQRAAANLTYENDGDCSSSLHCAYSAHSLSVIESVQGCGSKHQLQRGHQPRLIQTTPQRLHICLSDLTQACTSIPHCHQHIDMSELVVGPGRFRRRGLRCRPQHCMVGVHAQRRRRQLGGVCASAGLVLAPVAVPQTPPIAPKLRNMSQPTLRSCHK